MILHETTKRKTAVGLWRSAPHTRLHLYELHDTRRSALASARELLRKGWGDYFVVRRVTLGPATVVEEKR